MRKTIYAVCKDTGKRTYRTRAEALRALGQCHRDRSMSLRRRSPRILRTERRVYQCDWCGGFELTSLKEWSA